MRKKTRRNQSKSYKPVRITNPISELHTSRLRPCQSIKLTLSPPYAWLGTHKDDGCYFDVRVDSEWMLIEWMNVDERTGDNTYLISPKYDLTRWSNWSETHLGEIEIILTHPPESKSNVNYKVNILPIQIADEGKSGIITVINPHDGHVKVEAHQVLEVICYDSKWNFAKNDKWGYEKTDLNLPQMQEIASEVASTLDQDVLGFGGLCAKRMRIDLVANPKLDSPSHDLVEDVLKVSTDPLNQQHWWFGFEENTNKMIAGLSDDTYDCCHFDINGSAQSVASSLKMTTCRSLDVHLAVQGKNKDKIHSVFPGSNSVEWKMEMRRRSEDRSGIVNPLATEHLDFDREHGTTMIEIVQPNVFWEDLPDSERWEFKVEENRLSTNMVTMQILPPQRRFNREYQRIRVSHSCGSIPPETKFLGAVQIVCKAKEDCYNGLKRLSCWISPKGIIAASANSPVVTNPYVTKAAEQTRFRDNETRGWSSANYQKPLCGGKPIDYNNKPKVCTVEFSEIEIEDENDLSVGTKAKKIVDVYVSGSNDNCKKKVGQHDVGEEFLRDRWMLESQHNCQKDKEKDKKSGQTSTESSARSGLSSDGGILPDLLVYSPEDCREVKLLYGQALCLRLKPNVNDFWVPRISDSHKLCITRNVMVKVSDEDYQEIRVEPYQVPLVNNVYHCGSLRLETGKNTKITLFVVVKITPEDRVSAKEKSPPPQEISAGGEFNLIDYSNSTGTSIVHEWKHNDGFVIHPEKKVFLSAPIAGDSWEHSWTVELQQLPLPHFVTERLPDLADKVNLKNPWYREVALFGVNRKFYKLDPISETLPKCMEIVKILRDQYKEDKMLIAKLTFRNKGCAESNTLATGFGEITSSYEMSRTIGIYLSLAGKDLYSLTWHDPNNGDSVTIRKNTELIIKLPCRFCRVRGKMIDMMWYSREIPNFLSYKGMVKRDDMYVFRFLSVSEFMLSGATGIIGFSCEGDHRSITVRCP